MRQLVAPSESVYRFWTPPMVFPVLAFCAGIAMGQYYSSLFHLPVFVLFLAVLSCLFFYRRFSFQFACLIGLACFAGMIHHHRFNHSFPAHHIRYMVEGDSFFENQRAVLVGRVVSPSMILQPEKTFPYHTRPDFRTRFLVHVSRLEVDDISHPTTGLIEVSMPGMVDHYFPGQQVEITGRLVSNQLYPSAFPFAGSRQPARSSRVFARVLVNSSDDVIITSRSAFRLGWILQTARQAAHAMLLGYELPEGEHTAALLSAVVLGNRHKIQNDLNQAMVKIGAAHFLAVSGFHLAVLAGGVGIVGLLLGLSPRVTFLSIIGFAFAYAALTGFPPSATRAMIMIVVVSAGFLLNQPVHTLNSLAVAACIILLINPNQLFGPGFQLSFVATLGIILLSNPIYCALFVSDFPNLTQSVHYRDGMLGQLELVRDYVLGKIKLIFSASIAAALAAAPLVMVHFNLFSLIGPVSSVILFLPAVLLILTGFLQLLVSFIWLPAACFLGNFTDFIASVLSAVAFLLAKIPGASFDVASPSVFLIILYFVILFFALFRNDTPPLFRGWRLPALCAIIAVYLTLWIVRSSSQSPWVYIPRSAGGQAMVLHTGRETVLIDCGSYRAGLVRDLVRRISCNTLAEPHAVILTTPDQAFFNDLWSLADRYPNLRVFVPPTFSGELADRYYPVKTLLSDSNLTFHSYHAGTRLVVGRTSIEVLFPPQDVPKQIVGDAVVLLIDTGSQRILFGSNLNNHVCNLIRRNYDSLTADTLILSSPDPPGAGLESLIAYLRPERLIVTTRLRSRDTVWFETMAQKYDLAVIKSTSQDVLVSR